MGKCERRGSRNGDGAYDRKDRFTLSVSVN